MGYYCEHESRPVPALCMPRRPAVPLTPPHSLPDSALFCTFCTLLQKSEAHPLPFQPLPASLQNHRGWHQERRSHFGSRGSDRRLLLHEFALFTDHGTRSTDHAPATPLSATLTADLRVLPCFGRSCPSASPLDATLTKTTAVTPLAATLTKTRGRGPLLYACDSPQTLP
jgi:hypothetical protein